MDKPIAWCADWMNSVIDKTEFIGDIHGRRTIFYMGGSQMNIFVLAAYENSKKARPIMRNDTILELINHARKTTWGPEEVLTSSTSNRVYEDVRLGYELGKAEAEMSRGSNNTNIGNFVVPPKPFDDELTRERYARKLFERELKCVIDSLNEGCAVDTDELSDTIDIGQIVIGKGK